MNGKTGMEHHSRQRCESEETKQQRLRKNTALRQQQNGCGAK